MNPVTNKIYRLGNNGIDETPLSDTKLRVFFNSLPNIGFYNSTFLAQPPITGKAVNRLQPGRTGISTVLSSKTTAQSSWGHTSITNGAGTDSVSWEWVWGTDTLLFGENLLCAVALDSQTTSTNNPGTGTPFSGNVTVFPIYRLAPPPAAAPVLTAPADNSVGQSLLTSFSWNPVSGATYYKLQVSSDSLFSSFVFNSPVSGTSQTVSGLSYNVSYYWRVNAGNYSGISAWSSIWRFTTIAVPQAPTLALPTNGDTKQPLSPTLIWNKVNMADIYNVQIATDTGFTNIFTQGTALTDTLMPITGLSSSTLYYWRVNASNAAGTSPRSQTWSFTTVLVAPAAPILSSPANGSLDIITLPRLSWDTAVSATSYSVQVSTDSGFSSIVAYDSNMTATNHLVNGLALSTVYYWRVYATNTVGTGPWSQIWRFTTISTPPDSAVLTSPANGAISISTKPALSWLAAARAGSYIVQVSAASDFSSLVVNDSGIAITSHIAESLSAYTFYYWRVKAVNAVGESSWSGVRNFMTGPAAPSTPALVSPANGILDQPVSLSFVWNIVSTAASYHIQVATDTGFSNIFIQDSSLTDSLKSISGLSNSAVYYWRLRGKNAGGAGEWSNIWSFETGNTGVQPRPYALPTMFSIFGSSGIVRYSLASACHVSLKYYDLRGRLAATLVNTTQGAGYYILSVKNVLPSRGTYIRVFEAGVFVKRELVAMVEK